MMHDPTLQSCCRRDLAQQKKGNALRAELLSHDRTNVRLDLQAGACRM
jgi:hypothetical protein